MAKYFFSGVLCILVAAGSASGQLSDSDRENVSALVNDAAVDDACPGVVVAIIKDGDIAFRAAGGCRRIDEPDRLVSVDDKVHLGSCTKAMTATLIGVLVDEGTLSWDQTIGQSLPSLAQHIDQRYLDVSLWHLLTHRAGMAVANPMIFRLNGGFATHENRLEIAKAALKKMPDGLEPGKFAYSNLGYIVAALIAEGKTGISWEDLIADKVFRPLKMTTAGFGPPKATQPATQPWGHISNGAKLVPINFDNAASMSPAGRVHCSIEDWARFIRLHLDRDCLHHTLLQPKTLKRLQTPFAGPGEKYAAGWVTSTDPNGVQRLWHNGSNTFWYCCVHAIPEDGLAVMVVTNAASPKSQTVVEDLASSVLKQLTN